MRWSEFAAACPELAVLGEARFRERELCLVGTLRKNGWPRISPVEPDFVDGDLIGFSVAIGHVCEVGGMSPAGFAGELTLES